MDQRYIPHSDDFGPLTLLIGFLLLLGLGYLAMHYQSGGILVLVLALPLALLIAVPLILAKLYGGSYVDAQRVFRSLRRDLETIQKARGKAEKVFLTHHKSRGANPDDCGRRVSKYEHEIKVAFAQINQKLAKLEAIRDAARKEEDEMPAPKHAAMMAAIDRMTEQAVLAKLEAEEIADGRKRIRVDES